MSTNPLFVRFVTPKLIWWWSNNHRVKSWKDLSGYLQSNTEISWLLLAMQSYLKLIFWSKEWCLINLWMQIFDKSQDQLYSDFLGSTWEIDLQSLPPFFEEIELYQCSWNNSSLSGQVKMKRLDPNYQKYCRLRWPLGKIYFCLQSRNRIWR